MVHERFEFPMPAPAELVFDAFHSTRWRSQWDSLVDATHVPGGAPCPFVGAVTANAGGGLPRPLSMRTQFVSYEPARVAAATMRGRSFPVARWAASMRHRAAVGSGSVTVYTYRSETHPPALQWLREPVAKRVFDWQTRRRFLRMQRFLAARAADVLAWQQAGRPA